MNINKLNNRWPVTCRDSLAAIDRMGVSTALELGLITKEESDAITDAFVMNLTIAMRRKDMHLRQNSILFRIPKS